MNNERIEMGWKLDRESVPVRIDSQGYFNLRIRPLTANMYTRGDVVHVYRNKETSQYLVIKAGSVLNPETLLPGGSEQ